MKSELEMIHLRERHELSLPEIVNLFQSLIERGWVWKMPAEYHSQAVAFINMGLIEEEIADEMKPSQWADPPDGVCQNKDPKVPD